jgi:hypothetical protein
MLVKIVKGTPQNASGVITHLIAQRFLEMANVHVDLSGHAARNVVYTYPVAFADCKPAEVKTPKHIDISIRRFGDRAVHHVKGVHQRRTDRILVKLFRRALSEIHWHTPKRPNVRDGAVAEKKV